MRIASRFSIAVHILSLLEICSGPEATSEWMAGSIGVNPVIVRNVMGQLRRAGLVTTQQGVAGGRVARPLDQVSLLDVYRAVEVDGDLFAMHHPNPSCPVGANIQATLDVRFEAAQNALEAKLAEATVGDVVGDIRARMVA